MRDTALVGGSTVSEFGYSPPAGFGDLHRRSPYGDVPGDRTGRSTGHRLPTDPRQGSAFHRDAAGSDRIPACAPDLDESGTWRTDLDLTPGVWRFFADFRPAGHDEPMTLGVDVSVAGDFDPQPLPPVDRIARIDDYAVALAVGSVRPTVGTDADDRTDGGPQSPTCSPIWRPTGTSLRSGSGIWPTCTSIPRVTRAMAARQRGPDIAFFVTPPTPGSYRLHLDFQHGDIVRTARFTVEADPSMINRPVPPTRATITEGDGDASIHPTLPRDGRRCVPRPAR